MKLRLQSAASTVAVAASEPSITTETLVNIYAILRAFPDAHSAVERALRPE